ncbi:hypothetical protein D3C85_1309180 [compost metagenome]
MVFTDTPAGQQHLLPGVKTRIFARMDTTGKVNSRNHRKIADDFTGASDREGILVIQAGPVDIHSHVPLRETVFLKGLNRRQSFAVLLF